MNLFSNAIKFTEKGGKIDVRIREDDKNCFIEIEDTGVGIPSDMLDSIFDRFKQADGSSTRKFEGTGIGLSLAKELTELHGGTISVSSKHIDEYPDDHSTTFILTLPKGKDHLVNREGIEFITGSEVQESVTDSIRFRGMREMIELKESSDEVTESSGESSIQSCDILIVEDNTDMRNFLKTLLENIYTVHFAVDGMDKVGGDFYDFKVNDKRVELFIADVSGHGLPGAFLSMIARMTFESIGERKSTNNVL